jgi:hypothetical protein
MADPATVSAAASMVNAATPFVSRALGSAFGIKSAEDEERERIMQAMAPYMRVAEGGTTQGQAGLAYARGRAISDLESQAARGTAQQQAGMRREAMRQGADVQARYASQLAELRAVEQERARRGVAQGQLALADVAREEAKRKRDELAGFVEGVAGQFARMAVPGEGGKKKTGGRVRMGGSQTNAPGQSLAAPDAGAAAGVVNMPETVIASERQAPGVVTMPETVIGGPSVRDVGETRGPVQSLAQMQAPIAGLGATAQSLAPRRASLRIGETEVLGGAPLPTSRIDTSPFGSLGAAQGPDMTPSPIAMTQDGAPMEGLSSIGSAVRSAFNRPGAVPSAPMPVMPTRRKAVTAPKARKTRRVDFEF